MRRQQWALLRGDMATLPNLDRQLESMAGELKKPGKARGRELVKARVAREQVIDGIPSFSNGLPAHTGQRIWSPKSESKQLRAPCAHGPEGGVTKGVTLYPTGVTKLAPVRVRVGACRLLPHRGG